LHRGLLGGAFLGLALLLGRGGLGGDGEAALPLAFVCACPLPSSMMMGASAITPARNATSGERR
jgi:hypothetical protein